MQSKLVGVLVAINLLILCLGAGWIATQRPAVTPPAGPGDAADLLVRLDEFDRRLGNLERRADTVERIATQARDLAEALRDRPRAGGGVAPAPGSPNDDAAGSAGSTGHATGAGSAGGDTTKPAAEPTDDQLREARIRKIQDSVRNAARTWVPVQFAEMGSTDDRVLETRRTNARLESRQIAVALALTQEQADQLKDIWLDHADRTARDVGPLVRDGLEKADLDAVEARLGEAWVEMDRRCKDAIGDAAFQKMSEVTGSARGLIREVIGELRKRRK